MWWPIGYVNNSFLWLFSGTNCEIDLDECESNPCKNGATCKTLGTALDFYQCLCVTGYDGVNCETDIDECASNPCQNGATCTNHLGSYECACLPGTLGESSLNLHSINQFLLPFFSYDIRCWNQGLAKFGAILSRLQQQATCHYFTDI